MHTTSLRARSTRGRPTSSRVGGLTGLRALAVLAVLGYHLLPDALPGGAIGVDIFFVVSGFIVTRLLLVELAETGRIALREFWIRRARRLLPALVTVLAVSIPVAFVVDADLLRGIRRQLLGAVTFSSNWLAIAADGDYFRSAQPELFTNLWSLAVEEQFYLFCPIVLSVVLVTLRLPLCRIRIGLLVLAVASALAMSVLSGMPFGSPTRAYFGTDTHAFGLLIGVALALAMRSSAFAPTRPRRPGMRWAVGGASLVVLLVLSATMTSVGWFPAHGGLLLASVAAAALVWSAATLPALGRMLDVAPLRWLGERSYALYLWHWPLLLILGATPLGAAPLALAAVTAVLSVAAAAASYVVIEAPFRRGSGFPSRSDRRPARRRRFAISAVSGALVGALALSGIAIAVFHDDTTDAEQLVALGRAAIDDRQPSHGPATTPPSSPAPEKEIPTPPAPTPTAEPILGTDITAVGDSVMLAAAPTLETAFPGITIDADVSRSMWAAPEILSRAAADGALRPIVVLGLATNGEVEDGLLGKVLGIVGPDRTLVLVNGHADRQWIPGVNAELTAFAAAHPNVVVADWDGAIAPHPDELAGDGIHPEPAGGTVYVASVAAAITAARTTSADAGSPRGARRQDASTTAPATGGPGERKETPAP